jgi:hypothetical protein
VAFTIFWSILFVEEVSQAQWWNPFAPKDYEDCAESAARDARSKEALSILLSSCNSKFIGRRKPGGGYTFYDSRQGRSFDIAGPNPTPDEMGFVDKQYSIYLADIAKAKLRAGEVKREAEEAARQAAITEAKEQADFERRKQIARDMLTIQSTDLECKLFLQCGIYRLNITVINRSNETIYAMNFGWAFITSRYCPSAYTPKHWANVTLRPGDSTTINVEGFDGPGESEVHYCVGVTAVQILR